MRLRILLLFILALCAKYAAGQLPGKGLHFDGTDDHVVIQDADALDLSSSYTMECWIRPERFNFLAGIISKYNASPSNGYLLRLSGAFPYNGLSFDGMETATGILQADTWYHVAAVKNGSSRKLYVNGTEYPLHGTPVTVGANTDKLTLGVDYLPSPRYFKGVIDEVRIWNVARTQAEIQANMSSTIAPATAGLVAYYQFEEGTPGGDNTALTTVTDAAGSNNGTLANFTLTGNTSNWIGIGVPGPVAKNASNISGTGFTANWTAPPALSVSHYLLDISSSASFSTFLSGYNGFNAGNVTSLDITGLWPGSSWYYRVRAVTTDQQTTEPSNSIFVKTPGDGTPAGILYVNKNVSGGNQSGTSWANAIPELAEALKRAREAGSNPPWDSNNPLYIWVAGGVYTPLYSPAGNGNLDGGTHNSFLLVPNVKLYGGFAGTEETLADRNPDPEINKSILSGNLGDNTRAFHVVMSVGDVGAAQLDRFTISGGQSQSTFTIQYLQVAGINVNTSVGGGMINVSSAPTISNCTFSANHAPLEGGGICNNAASPTITNCTFSGNTTTQAGGGIANVAGSAPVISGCTFSENKSDNGGSGIFNANASPTITNCVFQKNSVSLNPQYVGSGGAMRNYNAFPVISNCSFLENYANNNGGAMYNQQSSPTLRSCMFSGNSTAGQGGAVANIAESNPTFINSSFFNNSGGYTGGAIHNNTGTSSSFINCTIAGNRAETIDGGGGIYSLSSLPLIIANSIISGNVKGSNNTVSNIVYSTPPADPLVSTSYSLIQGLAADPSKGILNGALDPMFEEPSVGNFRLKTGSPAIDTGLNDLFPNLASTTTDLAGNHRLSGSVIDMGAYEYFDALPVTLVSFKAAKLENAVRLTWRTTEEINLSRFEIQRSADARMWQAIGTVPAKTTGSYTFSDNFDYAQGAPLSTLLYYRLSIIDTDGSFVYSGIEAVSSDRGDEALTVRIYPNPAHKGKVRIELPEASPESARIQVFDLMGRKLHVVGTGAAELDVSRFAPGIYVVHIQQGSKTTIRKLIVE